jgi:hypothetical protein
VSFCRKHSETGYLECLLFILVLRVGVLLILIAVSVYIFKISYESGTIPAILKTANICPVYKKGKTIEAINYRPISLTCILCKLMEHIITSHIMKHADTLGLTLGVLPIPPVSYLMTLLQ